MYEHGPPPITIGSSSVLSLEKIGISRVPLDEKTLKLSRYSREIDHIFISDGFKVKNKQVIKDLEISDHYPVIVELEIR